MRPRPRAPGRPAVASCASRPPAAPACASSSASRCPSGTARAAEPRTRLVVLDDPVDEAVLDGLVGLEEAVALHVGVDLLDRLPGVLGVDLVDPLARLDDLAGVD